MSQLARDDALRSIKVEGTILPNELLEVNRQLEGGDEVLELGALYSATDSSCDVAIPRGIDHPRQTKTATEKVTVLFWLNPHEVIQSRESKRVGAKWTKVGANENKCMRE